MRRSLLPIAFAALLAAPCAALAQDSAAPPPEASIGLELNKLEQNDGACRAYFVVDNGTTETLRDLSLDVFVFDRDEVVARRVGLSFTGVRPDRRKIVLFDLDISCEEVGELLVNDVLSCEAEAGGPLADCGALISTSSRASAVFAY